MMQKADNTFTKITWQYTEILPEETMEFLRDIVADCGKVKAAVYERYSGIASLGKLASVFDIMTAMRHCGLREQLNLPSVYYELAVKEAVTDIKSGWSMLKNKLRTRITANENLSDDDRMYLRTILKMDETYAAILNRSEYQLPEKARGADIDTKHLNNLLRRLTRKYLRKPVVSRADSFCVPPVGYSYRNGTLCLASRTRRKRVVLPLKDDKTSNRQIRVCVKENYAAIAIPVEVRKQKHLEFLNTIYVHLGYQNMCTLSSGCIYGRELGSLLEARTERLMEKNQERARMRTAYRKSLAAGDVRKADRIEENNLGLRKYAEQKFRERGKIESYVNAEINRMLETEKPCRVVITRPVTRNRTKFRSKAANRRMAESFRGYIRKRLKQKCELHSIELVEINSKGTGSVCSQCGSAGRRLPEGFVCEKCGYRASIALNGAKNIERKYREISDG